MNIIYLCNYMEKDILEQRNNLNTFAQAANNKINQVTKAFELNNHKVTLLSTGLVNNKSFKFFKGFKSEKTDKLFYISIIDFPILNVISSILFGFFKIYKMNQKEKIDYIIFWNYKPEVSILALMCKLLLNISIIVDYEDGYFTLSSISKLKRYAFNLIEKISSGFLDGALLISKNLIPRIGKKKHMVLEGLTNEQLIHKRVKRPKQINKKITLMYAGGLDHERGIDILINAVKDLKADFVLKISGKGDITQLLKQTNQTNIEFLGFLDYEEMIEHMLDADILINPQRELLEFAEASFPSKIFDYITMESLIISSNIGDMEGFSKGAFYIYYNDNPEELSLKIKEAIDDIEQNNHLQKLEKIRRLRDEYLPQNIGEKIENQLLN